ncbi:MAG: PspC domain-containing protein [Chitinophagaceae bacterium]|nr:PspC domain-containing protein [Chitinophagaceae bacterium]
MEKVININFQGRVIPIEETAYNHLKQYTDSLRRHFAGEESGEEIINDIENRIAELLTARLKQGAACINSADMNAVIDNIGRIEDLMAADGEETTTEQDHSKQNRTENQPPRAEQTRLFRNADDKIIAGVCSGIAARLNMDPVIVRILFVFLFGALFWIYILLWLIVPMQSIETNTTHRLYRNPDDKVIAGVCGGMAVYFKLDSWKVRAIFLLPLIISVFFKSMSIFTWHVGLAPGIFLGSFGSTLFLLYVILWITLPYATSGTEKMELRGEKIDINSIKAATQARTTAAAKATNSFGSSIGRLIAILVKSFLLLVAGSIALGLFAGLIGLIVAGTAISPYAAFFLSDTQEYSLVWLGIGLTMGMPLLAMAVWLIRRMTGARSHRHYLAYVFSALWIVGIIIVATTGSKIAANFSNTGTIEEELQIAQPSTGRLFVKVDDALLPTRSMKYNRWFNDMNDDNNEFKLMDRNTLWLNNVKLNIERSEDTLFHVYETRSSRGSSSREASVKANKISFVVTQLDSVLTLPRGFVVNSRDKFCNQQVLITVEVPVGKTLKVSEDINEYSWYTINVNGNGVYRSRHWSDNDDLDFDNNTEYIMTTTGLKDIADTASE